MTASVGTAKAECSDTLEDLMHRADTAMYAQKTRVDRRAPSATTRPAVALHRAATETL